MRSRIVLVIEDATARRFVRSLLRTEDYEVRPALSVLEGAAIIADCAPDLVLAAANVDAVAATIAELRGHRSDVPFLILTSAHSEAAIAGALDAGADDAVSTESGAELVARIRLALRRGRPSAAPRDHAFGPLTFDRDARELRVTGRRVALTRLEYRLLEELALAKGRAVAHALLLTRLWGPTYATQLHYLRVYVARLRRKLEKHHVDPGFIVTVASVGYRLDVALD